MMRMVVARLIVAILLGIAVGYAVGKSTAADAERGNALTMSGRVCRRQEYRSRCRAWERTDDEGVHR